MISRRVFAGCGLCAAAGLMATSVSAQGNPGFSRSILNRAEMAGTNLDTIQVAVAIDPKAVVARHTHPGTESGVVVEGGGTLQIEGQPDRAVKAGDTFFVPRGVPHALLNSDAKTRVVSTYTVDRDKPLASPA